MIQELIQGHKRGDFDLHENHSHFLETLNENLDPNVQADTELQDWQIRMIYWLVEWKLNDHFVPLDEFDEDDYE